MAVNDIIVKADYNSIRTKVVQVLGVNPGGVDYGYGQTVRSSAVDESSRVTVNEWGNLLYDITNCLVHQTGSGPASASTATEGATVRFNATTSPITQYDTFANTIVTNRWTVAGSQAITTAKGSVSETWPGTYGATWNSTIQSTVRVTFTTADLARAFFNSGGEIRFASSRTGSVTRSQDNAWTNLLSTAGTRAFGGNKPTTGVGVLNGQNFYRLTSSFQEWSAVAASSPYTLNKWAISARCRDVANNSLGTSRDIEFLVQWVDGYVDPGNFPGDTPNDVDQVSGTISLTVTTLEASGVLQPAGAGNFTVESPTVTISAIAP